MYSFLVTFGNTEVVMKIENNVPVVVSAKDNTLWEDFTDVQVKEL